MPSLPKRPCSVPGCPTLVDNGRCPSHQRKQEQLRGSSKSRGYDRDHRTLRILAFARDNWTCVDCGWQPTLVTLYRIAGMGIPPTDVLIDELRKSYNRNERHLHADHEIPIEERPDLRLDLANLTTRCNVCHNAKTAREDGGFGK